MEVNICKDDNLILLNANCPVIKDGTKVKVLHVFEFLSTNTLFITIEDLKNRPVNKYGEEVPIVSTIKYSNSTFQDIQ